MSLLNDFAKEEVRSKSDIAVVIGRYVGLKASGRTLKGLCPFHKEKTPSFHVDPVQGFFHCFGCGKGGDVFTFIQEIEGIGFAEALSMLADECGITLQKVSDRRSPTGSDHGTGNNGVNHEPGVPSKAELLRIHEVASNFFYHCIKPSAIAVSYLKSRGLRPETVRDFRLGFAPDHWTGLIDYCRKQGIEESLLVDCGLAVRKESGRCHDRFRNRIIFSLCDYAGRVIGFAGRSTNSEAQPKYLNSPETLLYKKKSFLYGLDRARSYIKESQAAVIVEGYMDYLTLFQAGVRNIVATSGTALTPEHAQILSRFTNSIILTFDGDSAGQNAAERAISTLVPLNPDLSVLILPGGDDPDSLVRREGREKFEQLLRGALPWHEFIIERMMKSRRPDSSRGKVEIIEALAPIVASMKNEIAADHFRQRISEKLGIEPRLVHRHLPVKTGYVPQPGPSLLNSDSIYQKSLEGQFLRYLFLQPELVDEARNYIAPETLTDPVSGDIYSLMLKVYDREHHFGTILNYTDDPEIKRRISLLQVKEDVKEHIHDELVQKIIHLRKKHLQFRRRECKLQMKREPHRRSELLHQLNDYLTQLHELDGEE